MGHTGKPCCEYLILIKEERNFMLCASLRFQHFLLLRRRTAGMAILPQLVLFHGLPSVLFIKEDSVMEVKSFVEFTGTILSTINMRKTSQAKWLYNDSHIYSSIYWKNYLSSSGLLPMGLVKCGKHVSLFAYTLFSPSPSSQQWAKCREVKQKSFLLPNPLANGSTSLPLSSVYSLALLKNTCWGEELTWQIRVIVEIKYILRAVRSLFCIV